MPSTKMQAMVDWSRDNPTPGAGYAGYRRIMAEFDCTRTDAAMAAKLAAQMIEETQRGPNPDANSLFEEVCLPEEYKDPRAIPEDWEQMVEQLISHQEWLRKHEVERNEVTVRIETDKPVVTVVRGDGHLANVNTDHVLWRAHHRLLLAKPYMYELNTGDNWDGAIKAKMSDLIQEQLVRTKVQRMLWWHAYRPVAAAGKLLAIVHGQHDGTWSSDEADFNPIEWFASEFKGKVAYLGAGGTIHLIVGDVQYDILMRHRFRMNSAQNPEHSARQMIRQLNTSVDIAIVADKHTSACAPYYEGGRHYWVLRPSSYKREDNYSKEHGFPAQPTCMPALLLWPAEKKILGFERVEDAVLVYEALFGG